MNASVNNLLVISAKNAVRAVLNNVGAWGIDPDHFNVVTRAGIKHVALLAASTVVSAEAVYWAPKILKWAQAVPPIIFAALVQLIPLGVCLRLLS